jgi:CheY-like chemotaxis protein
MPRKNGFDVMEWVRQQEGLRRLPIVVLSSSKEDPDVNRAYDLGANSYLVKPLNYEALVEMTEALNHFWLVLAQKPGLLP